MRLTPPLPLWETEGSRPIDRPKPLIRHGLRIADAKHRRPIKNGGRRPPTATFSHKGRREEGAPHFTKDNHPMDIKVRDSNGALLAEGDSVTLIKDLKLKGSSTVLKRGTMIK